LCGNATTPEMRTYSPAVINPNIVGTLNTLQKEKAVSHLVEDGIPRFHS
jgi:hypothetical protein